MLASDGGAPAPRRPATRLSDAGLGRWGPSPTPSCGSSFWCWPRTVGPQPHAVLRLVFL